MNEQSERQPEAREHNGAGGHGRRDAGGRTIHERHHRNILFLAGAAFVAVAATAAAMTAARERRRRALSARLPEIRSALARMQRHPKRVAQAQPSVSRKIVGAVGASVAAVLARRITEWLVPGEARRQVPTRP